MPTTTDAVRQYRVARVRPAGSSGTVAHPNVAGRATAGASAPLDIRFADGGGLVLPSVHVWPIFWGSSWATARAPAATQIKDAITTMLAGPYMSALDQYRNIQKGSLVGSTMLTTSDPGDSFSNEDVIQLIYGLLLAGTIPEPVLDPFLLYVVFLPPGIPFAQPGVIGEHSYFTYYDFSQLALANAELIANVHYGWVINDGTLDLVTTVFSHELVEACADPEGTAITGLEGSCQGSGWCEIGDVCASTGVVDGVAVQSYWSQRDRACVVPGAGNGDGPAPRPLMAAAPPSAPGLPDGSPTPVASAVLRPVPTEAKPPAAGPPVAPAPPAPPSGSSGRLARILSLDLPPAFFFWLELLYLILLIVGAVAWVKGSFLHSVLPDPIGPVPISIPWFGALGAVLISLAGISAHNRVGARGASAWDPSYNFWHVARPAVGAAVGTVGYLLFAAVIDATRTPGTPPSPGTAPVSNLIAFLLGYREESFRELIKRAVDLLLVPATRPAGPPSPGPPAPGPPAPPGT